MTSTIIAVGLDPGPTPGLVRLVYVDGLPVRADVMQVSAGMLTDALRLLLTAPSSSQWAAPLPEIYLGAEKFVMKGKYSATGPGRITQQQVGLAVECAASLGVHALIRPAVTVKQWATDARLEKAGLLTATKGMRHAKDAARHALFTAVSDGRMPDPLSRRAQGG